MVTVTASRDRYNELKKNPILFFHEVDYPIYDKEGNLVEVNTYWEPVNSDFKAYIPKDILKEGNVFGYKMVIAEEITENSGYSEEKDKINVVSIPVHEVDALNLDDWCIVINSFIIRSRNSEDKFPYIHLLWMLNFQQWKYDVFLGALNLYDSKSRSFIIEHALKKITRCLSENKQKQIRQSLSQLGYSYEDICSFPN